MTALGNVNLEELGEVLRRRGLDGWLIYDFRGVNPLSRRLLGPMGMVTRRVFVWLPATGKPRLIVHNIDRIAIHGFPGDIVAYTTWQELHQAVGAITRGRRVAMEISPENAVPYLDRVPAGVIELLTRLGAIVVPSDLLVSRFAARLTAAEMIEHRQAAETIAGIARQTMQRVVVREPPLTEFAIQQEILGAFERASLKTDDPPIVAFGAHAADPHYAPTEGSSAPLAPGQVVLIDLWARTSDQSVWADQTWMGFAGGAPPAEVLSVWEAVRNARDAAVHRLRDAMKKGETVTGADVDRAARGVIERAGHGAAFGHRTGHSIEQDLHGSGPHLDDFETHDARELIPGIAFSIEPGIYLEGKFGMRSEINVIVGDDEPEVTPAKPQQQLITG